MRLSRRLRGGGCGDGMGDGTCSGTGTTDAHTARWCGSVQLNGCDSREQQESGDEAPGADGDKVARLGKIAEHAALWAGRVSAARGAPPGAAPFMELIMPSPLGPCAMMNTVSATATAVFTPDSGLPSTTAAAAPGTASAACAACTPSQPGLRSQPRRAHQSKQARQRGGGGSDQLSRGLQLRGGRGGALGCWHAGGAARPSCAARPPSPLLEGESARGQRARACAAHQCPAKAARRDLQAERRVHTGCLKETRCQCRRPTEPQTSPGHA